MSWIACSVKCGKSDLRIRYLLLDREFYNVDVVCYLKRVHCPFLMPVARRGKRPKDPAQAASVWRFFAWKRSGWSTQTMQYKGRGTEVKICVACDNDAGRRGRHGRRTLVFAYWGFQPASPRWTRETYRKRFGIETSYRQVHQALPRTSSRRPALRLLYIGIALLLRNVLGMVSSRLHRRLFPWRRRLDALAEVAVPHALARLLPVCHQMLWSCKPCEPFNLPYCNES